MSQDIQHRIESAAKEITCDPTEQSMFVVGAGWFQDAILPEEMGKFSEWVNESVWVWWPDEKCWTDYTNDDTESITTPQLIELFKKRDTINPTATG